MVKEINLEATEQGVIGALFCGRRCGGRCGRCRRCSSCRRCGGRRCGR